jgi:hypothetical protein
MHICGFEQMKFISTLPVKYADWVSLFLIKHDAAKRYKGMEI